VNPLAKYLQSYFAYKLQTLVAGRTWRLPEYSLVSTKIKNKKLADELEKACEKDGFLLYSEYLQIAQYGKNGYHSTHTYHGRTDTYTRWPESVVRLCEKEQLHHIIEFGCGDGTLGLETMKYARSRNYPLHWTGIDMNQEELEKAKRMFEKEHIHPDIYRLATEFLPLHSQLSTSLVLFSYSLDSIPPEIFINTNTQNRKTMPNALIGITVKEGLLSEIILTEKLLKQKNISFRQGIYSDRSGLRFDLTSWQLYLYQRAYIPIHSFAVLSEYAREIPKNSLFVILDEFQPPLFGNNANHLCLPKDLDKYTYNREAKNLKKTYQNSGNDLFYYSSYLQTYMSVLKSLGFTDIKYEEERLYAEILSGKPKFLLFGQPLIYAIFARNKNAIKQNIKLLLS